MAVQLLVLTWLFLIAACATPTPLGSPIPKPTPTIKISTPTPVVPTPIPAGIKQPAGLELVSQLGGVSRAVAVQGSYAYVGVGPRLIVYDVSQPEASSAVGQSGILPGVVGAVVLNESVAYVAAGSSIYAFDVSDPHTPRRLGHLEGLDYDARSLAVAGRFAFVGGGSCEGRKCTGSLWTIDISDPTNLVLGGALNLSGIPVGIVVSNQMLYIALWDPYGRSGGMAVVDFSEPQALEEVGLLNTGYALAVAISGRYAYLGNYDDLRVIDVADSSNPVQVGYILMLGGSFDDIVVSGGLVFAASRFCEFEICHANIHVIDVSDPTQPVSVEGLPAAVGPGETASGHTLAIVGNLAFFATEERLEIYDVSDPESFRRGSTKSIGWAQEVSVNDGIVLVVESGGSPQPPSFGCSGSGEPFRGWDRFRRPTL